MALVRVLCIKDLNLKLVTDTQLQKGIPKDGPKEGQVYTSDSFAYFKQWGFYIHLTEFPNEDGWNADKFVFADVQHVNVSNYLYEMYRDQIV